MRRTYRCSRRPGWLPALAIALMLAPGPAGVLAAPDAAVTSPGPAATGWLGEQLPLPLVVKTPQDLALKAAAERQYLIFNLLARGKLAWDGGDFAVAAAKWEELLQLPGLDPELDRVLRPLASDARARSGGAAGGSAATTSGGAAPPTAARFAPSGPVVPMVMLSGTVSGGGAAGPAGTIVWLRRTDGGTPRPGGMRGRSMSAAGKTFVPRALMVTTGSTVTFINKDTLSHNLFSMSPTHTFDGGLSKPGQSFTRTFTRAGAVEILCNIHASERAHVVVVDSPYHAEVDGRGRFTITGLPPGDYDLEAWHAAAPQTTRMRVRVGTEGVRGVSVKVGSGGNGTQARP